jgi:APA family basic amino acid/polyamine antiporter
LEPEPTRARKPLGLTGATAIVVANMVGTGIFTTTGFMASELEPGTILVAWVIGGALALCGALVYAELGAMLPHAGGEYVYLREAFHPLVGFLSGWLSLFVGFAVPIAAASLAFGSYLGAVLPVPPVAAALVLIVLLTLQHMVDVEFGARVQTAFTIVKVLLIVVLLGGALLVGKGDWANVAQPIPDVARSLAAPGLWFALVYVSFSYSGWNAAGYVAGEIERPQLNIPRALLIGTSIVTVLYLALNLTFLYAAPRAELAGTVEVGSLAAERLFGPAVARWLSLLIAITLVSTVSAMVMAGPRVYAAMAKDGLLFGFLAKHNRRGAPAHSILWQGALSIVFALLVPFASLLEYAGFMLSLSTALTVVAAFVLRRKRPDADRPYRALGWPITPLLFVGLSLWMAVHLIVERPLETLGAGLLTLASGGVVYAAGRRRRRAA